MKKKVYENRRHLIPIVKTILFCRQEKIPLRGHQDDSDPITHDITPSYRTRCATVSKFVLALWRKISL